jgi:DNA-binding YbaB/EbfC family protein
MFGALGNLANVMKQAAQIKENMQKHQEQLARQTHEADAGGGLVKVTVNGRCELVKIKIDPEAAKDVELLEDLVKAAIGAATKKAQEAAKQAISEFTGGLNIPGLEEMLGGDSGPETS